jgi:hypothetical protein
MSRYAIVQDNEVVNVALWDGKTEYNPDGELVALADDEVVGPGWTRSKGKWVAPPESEADAESLK